MSSTQLVLLASAGLIIWGARRHPAGTMPLAMRCWVHLTVTWPIAMKIPLLGLIVSPATLGPQGVLLALYGPGILAGIVVLISRMRSAGVWSPYGPAWILLGAIFLQFPTFLIDGSVSQFMAFALILPTLLRPEIPITVAAWSRELTNAWAIVTSIVAVAALASPATVIGICPSNKCTLTGGSLISEVTGNGNFLGIAIALTAPIVFFGMRPVPLLATAAGGFLLIDTANSRTALAAYGVAVAVAIAQPIVNRKTAIQAAVALALGSVAVSVYFAYTVFPPRAFTDRGQLWIRARELIDKQPWFGYGPSYWSDQINVNDVAANYSPHNIWLEVLVAGGIVLTALCTIALLGTVLSTRGQTRLLILNALTALLLVGMFEAPAQPYKLALAPFAVLLIVAIASSSPDKPLLRGARVVATERDPLAGAIGGDRGKHSGPVLDLQRVRTIDRASRHDLVDDTVDIVVGDGWDGHGAHRR